MFKHPALGEAEIGGFIPFMHINPPQEEMEGTLSFHTDYCIRLIDRMAGLRIDRVNVRALGDSLYRVTVRFDNPGRMPTSTAHGLRTRTSWPITVRIKTTEGQMLWAGEPFEEIPSIRGGGFRTLESEIKGKRESQVLLTADSYRVGKVKTVIELK